jgi:hypothetical protein
MGQFQIGTVPLALASQMGVTKGAPSEKCAALFACEMASW